MRYLYKVLSNSFITGLLLYKPTNIYQGRAGLKLANLMDVRENDKIFSLSTGSKKLALVYKSREPNVRSCRGQEY